MSRVKSCHEPGMGREVFVLGGVANTYFELP